MNSSRTRHQADLQQSVSAGEYVGVKSEKLPVMVPLTGMCVGIEAAMESHFAKATVSPGIIDAGCHVVGKDESCEDTGS